MAGLVSNDNDRVTLQAYKNVLAYSKFSGGIPAGKFCGHVDLWQSLLQTILLALVKLVI